MDDTTVVWVAPARGEADLRALREWALARGLRLVAPREGRAPVVPVDLEMGTRVEEELARARDAVAAQEVDAAERALARGEQLLRAHPELPHAAWLAAEVHRGWAARWRRLEPHDDARADAAWKQAEGLDGGRTAGVGELPASAAPMVRAVLELEGDELATHGLELQLDGVAVTPGEVRRPAGEHALRVLEGGIVRWAAWVSFVEGTRVRIPPPGAPACSTGDLAHVLPGEPVRAAGVQCGAWVAASPAPDGGLLVATCEGAHCGPRVAWRVGGLAGPRDGGGAEPPSWHWPAWLTATLVGAGAVAATTAVLAATGAFEKPAPETHWVSGGLKVQSR